MLDSFKNVFGSVWRGLSRRELFRRGGLLARRSGIPRNVARGAGRAGCRRKAPVGPDIYKSIGVRPVINCRGTLTVISGSLELPEVRAAVDAGGQHHVVLDELMEAIARRLAELTGAEWALVSSGCAAGMAHTTAACVTGGNPDLHVRIPDLTGFAKDEVVIPKASRNEYDQAIRSVGVRIIEVGDAAEYEAALGPKVAMVYIMSGPRMESGPLNYDAVYSIAKKKNIPVFTDAAAEMLTVPNIYLQRGSTFVGYSGGKCLRGPQCAGLILGRKDLLQAAWVSSAPHHGHGRTMKIGKEEMVGLLAAVEMWVQRDHKKEDEMWTQWMQTIADRVTKIDGVTATVRAAARARQSQPGALDQLGSRQARHHGRGGHEYPLDHRAAHRARRRWRRWRPRRTRRASNQTGISITAYMMMPGRRQDRRRPGPRDPLGQAAGVETGAAKDARWRHHRPLGRADRVRGRQFASTRCTSGSRATSSSGTHQGDFMARDFSGTISGDDVRIASNDRRGPRRRALVPLLREARGRHDVRRAGHGRVSGREVDGHAARVRPRGDQG